MIRTCYCVEFQENDLFITSDVYATLEEATTYFENCCHEQKEKGTTIRLLTYKEKYNENFYEWEIVEKSSDYLKEWRF